MKNGLMMFLFGAIFTSSVLAQEEFTNDDISALNSDVSIQPSTGRQVKQQIRGWFNKKSITPKIASKSNKTYYSGTSVVNVSANNKNYPKALQQAFEAAFDKARAEFVFDRVGDQFSDKEVELFENGSSNARDFNPEMCNSSKLGSIWNSSTKKMILVGVNYPDEELNNLMKLYSEDNSVLILTETTSNLYLEKGINSIDQLIFSLTEDEFQELQPEVLITFGGMIVSKKVKQFLRKYQPEHHWHIDEQKSINTFFCLSEFIKIKPIDFFKKFNFKITQIKSNYQNSWLDCRDEKRLKHQQYLEKTTHSDFKVFEQVLLSIPNGCQLQISNSSIIRYAQLFQLNKKNTVS